jgi:site-specific DNA-methyltransferase (adenine-specific)
VNWNNLELPDRPYYQDDAVVIYHADCRDILPLIPNKGIDLVLTDPPYNVGKKYGIWDDDLPDKDYLMFCQDWIGATYKICNKMVIIVPTKYILDYWQLLGHEFKQIIITWHFAGALRFGFINQFSSILTNAKPRQRIENVWRDMHQRGLGFCFPEDTFGHPGYTPEDVTSRALITLSPDSALILDPFLGSGTTTYCAKKLNRKCIGIEIEEKYCEIAANRCRQMVMNLNNREDRDV